MLSPLIRIRHLHKRLTYAAGILRMGYRTIRCNRKVAFGRHSVSNVMNQHDSVYIGSHMDVLGGC